MDPIFRKITITSVPTAIEELRQVRFPHEYITAEETIILRRDVLRNVAVLDSLVHHLLPAAKASPGIEAVLKQLRVDLFAVKRECGKVAVSFLRPRPKRIVARLQQQYEEMRTAAVLLCQAIEPQYMDVLALAL